MSNKIKTDKQTVWHIYRRAYINNDDDNNNKKQSMNKLAERRTILR